MHTCVQLLGTDRAQSVIVSLPQKRLHHCYDPFGQTVNRSPGTAGFNGAYQESPTGHYLLGNGYRAYSSVLRRFISPVSLSPFGKGGLNTYAYCKGDAVNARDPSGHWPTFDNLVKNIKLNQPFTDMFKTLKARYPQTYAKEFGDQSTKSLARYLNSAGQENMKNLSKSATDWAEDLATNRYPQNISETQKYLINYQEFATVINKHPEAPILLLASDRTLENLPLTQKNYAKQFIGNALSPFIERSEEGMARMRTILQEDFISSFTGTLPTWYHKSVALNSGKKLTFNNKIIRRNSI